MDAATAAATAKVTVSAFAAIITEVKVADILSAVVAANGGTGSAAYATLIDDGRATACSGTVGRG